MVMTVELFNRCYISKVQYLAFGFKVDMMLCFKFLTINRQMEQVKVNNEMNECITKTCDFEE